LHSVGYFMNVIAELGKHHKITQVQTRLIALEMEKQLISDASHIPQEDRSKCHHFSCHRFEILKSNILIISEIFIKDILHFHDLAGYMLAHCTWHEHE